MAKNGNVRKVLCFVWKIENFSMLPHQKGDKLESETFVMDGFENVDFYLSLYPSDDGEKLALFLMKKQEDLYLTLNLSFSIESAVPFPDLTRIIRKNEARKDWGLLSFVSVKQIFENELRYLPDDTLTIRCEIVSTINETPANLAKNITSKSTAQSLRKCLISRTCIQIQRKAVTWPIKNIRNRMKMQESFSILLTSSLNNSPSLKITLTSNKIKSHDYVRILIQQTCLSSKDVRLFAKFKITVISSNRIHQVSEESTHLFKLDLCDVWCFPPFLKTIRLTPERHLYADDTLLLLCEFTFSHKDRIYNLENNHSSFQFENTRKKFKIDELGSCIENIYTNGRFCDVELKAGGKLFPYYKVVLCAMSPVFGAMFETNEKDTNSKVVEITDVDPDTLKRLLEYMHTNVMEGLSFEDALKLYKAACKYEVESLKDQCSILLTSTLSETNVCELITLAGAHQNFFLMRLIDNFIVNHREDIFFQSRDWNSFMNSSPIPKWYMANKHRL